MSRISIGATMGPVQTVDWKPLRIGAGGWVTGIDSVVSGGVTTLLCKTDQYGCYLWDAGDAEWVQLVTSDSMPAADVGPDGSGSHCNCYEARISPSNPSRLYMVYSGPDWLDWKVYRSDNSGGTWTQCSSFPGFAADSNDAGRMFGPKMIVDPANDDVVYVSSPEDGVYYTDDAGANWTLNSTVPGGLIYGSTYPGHPGMRFDHTSGTTGGKTNTIYLPSWGNGVWRSTNAGSTWTKLTTGTGPTRVVSSCIGADGSFWCIDYDTSTLVWKYSGATWTSYDDGSGREKQTVICDPSNSSRVVTFEATARRANQSLDGGSTWVGTYWDDKCTLVATDIPWLAWTSEVWLSSGTMTWDSVSGRIYCGEGIGVFYTTFPSTVTDWTWTSQSKGIEQLVSQGFTSPPGTGLKPIAVFMDRPIFRVTDPDVFPSTHGTNIVPSAAISMGTDADWASSDPSFAVATAGWWGEEQAAYSDDNGQSWTEFPTYPAWMAGQTVGWGGVAVSTPDNIVWAGASGAGVFYTTDQGVNWTLIPIPANGWPDTLAGWQGFGWGMFLRRKIVAADRVTANKFYLFCSGYGLYTSTNGGASWTRTFAGEIINGSGYHTKLKSVPSNAGHLFFCVGQSGDLDDATPQGYTYLARSTDGGATWTNLPNVYEPRDFAFGAPASPGGYPSVYMVGWVGATEGSSVWGVWQSDNADAATPTWTNLGTHPYGCLDDIWVVGADMNVYGRCFVGFGGYGFVYRG